jgi:hypothetical protein
VKWLEEFHINKYVKPYDARTEGRYLNPPAFKPLAVGERVFIAPRGRFKFCVPKSLWGKYGVVKEVTDNVHRQFGRRVRVELSLTGEIFTSREAAFRHPGVDIPENDGN